MSVQMLREALAALEYHQAQTRPIQRTQETIAALRTELNFQVFEEQAALFNHRTQFLQFARLQGWELARMASGQFRSAQTHVAWCNWCAVFGGGKS